MKISLKQKNKVTDNPFATNCYSKCECCKESVCRNPPLFVNPPISPSSFLKSPPTSSFFMLNHPYPLFFKEGFFQFYSLFSPPLFLAVSRTSYGKEGFGVIENWKERDLATSEKQVHTHYFTINQKKSSKIWQEKFSDYTWISKFYVFYFFRHN